jgi:anion-transporting  ArsA/GET3 family ATPase
MLSDMPALLDHQLVFVTGKGGVGKTTVAAAAGLRAAREGRRVVVLETGAAQRLPAMFGVPAPERGTEVQLADGLWTTSVDTPDVLEEWVAFLLRSRALVQVLTRSNMFRNFVEAAPGTRELLTITRAWELVQPRRWQKERAGYDLVVVDAPASGHGIGMLRTPRTFADIARVGPLHGQAQRVREWLEDSRRTAYLAVALPAEMPISETLELEGRLRHAIGRNLTEIVVNAVLPRRFAPAELEQVGAVLDGHPAAAAAHAEAARARAQHNQVARLRRGADAPVRTLPFVFRPALGIEDVEELAQRL